MLGFLTWRIGAIILAGGLALAAIDAVRQRVVISALQTANQNLGTCHASVATLKGAVDVQSADIRRLAESSATATAKAEQRLAEIAKEGKAAREASQRVLALPRPSPDMACEAAAKLLRGGL